MARIGNIELDVPFFQAGLAGYSDTAMRLVARRHGCPYCVTEAMLDQLLIRGGKGRRIALLDERDHPVGGQLMGCDPGEMAQGAKILLGLGYDAVDVNLACPVKKVRKRARGGHLLGAAGQAIAILAAVRDALPPAVPSTVKLRRAWDETPEAQEAFHEIFEAAIGLGYAAATVHGRTVQQKYGGRADWQFLAALVSRYRLRGMAIFGSGDIESAADVVLMMQQTGVDGVAMARGCIGNPWIFRQARALLAGDALAAAAVPTLAEQREVLLEHFDVSVRTHGERRAGMLMRKFGIKYARHHRWREEVARAFVAVRTSADWRAVVERYYALSDAARAAALPCG